MIRELAKTATLLLPLAFAALPAVGGTTTFGAKDAEGTVLSLSLDVATTALGDAVFTMNNVAGAFSGRNSLTVMMDSVPVGNFVDLSETDCVDSGTRTLTIPQSTIASLIQDGQLDIQVVIGFAMVSCDAGGVNGSGQGPYTHFGISGGSLVFDSPSASTSSPAEATATQTHLAQTSGALMRLQPNLVQINTQSRTGRGTPSLNAQVTQGVGFVDLQTGGGPVWATVQAERQEVGTTSSVFGLASFGTQWEMGTRSAVGAMLQLDMGRSEAASGVDTASRGAMLGAYTVQGLGALTFDGRVMAGRSLTDVTSGGATASDIGGTRVLATARLSGTQPLSNGHELTPRFGLSYARQTMDAYTVGGTAVASQTQTMGEAELGADWGIPVALETGTGRIKLGASALYVFDDSAGSVLSETLRGRVDLGYSFVSDAGGPSLTAGIYADGIGADGFTATGASASLDWQF